MDTTPDDNTTVIRMKRDFESFLSNSSYNSGIRFDLDRTTDRYSDSQFSESHSNMSVKALLEKEKENRLKEAEIAAAKSKIAELENKVISVETASKRSRIEMDRNFMSLKGEKQMEEEKLTGIRSQFQFMCDQEKQFREEIERLNELLKGNKTEYDNKMLTMQREKMHLKDELTKLRNTYLESNTELKKDLLSKEKNLQLSKLEVEETKSQLQVQLRQIGDFKEQIKDLEMCKLTSMQESQKIKDLELKISRMEEDNLITQAMKSQLTAMPELEKETRKLREDNAHLRDIQENNMLLKEQAESLRKKLERAELHCEDYAKLATENSDLKHRLEKWEMTEMDGIRLQTPAQLSQRVGYLQESQAVLLEKQGQLQASLHSQEDSKRVLQQKYDALSKQYEQEKLRTKKQADDLKRLMRKLPLIVKERDSYKQIIDSYESEVTVNIGTVATSRLQQQEEIIEGYRRQMEQLEAEINRLSSNMDRSWSSRQQAPSDINGSFRSAEDQTNQKIILQLRERIEVLEKQLEKMEEEKFVLESRIEQRHLQGDYDPTKTKVLHFSMNPVALKQQQKKEEVVRLTEENEKLKHRIQLLENAEGKVDDLTIRVEQKLQEPNLSKEVDDMKAQLSREEMKNKRLMEAFKKTSQEFREACYQLTGYRIDFSSSKQYKLTSMYADSPEDFFLFQQTGSGELQLLGTDFSSTLKEAIELYLQNQDSIPAFLSSVTLDLFSRQTMVS